MRISPEAAGVLKREAIHAYKSIPRRGAEAGGLLCGTLTPEVQVDLAVPVPVEYRFGPTYRLSEMDKAKFARAIAGNKNVVGWYRSQTRTGVVPADEDRAMAREFFPAGESAFLLCFPDAQYNVNSQLRVWKCGDGERLTELPLGRFSLLEEALEAAHRADENEAEVEAQVQAEAEAESPPAAAAPQPVRHYEPPLLTLTVPPANQYSFLPRAAGIAALALCLLAGAMLFFRTPAGAPVNATVHANNSRLGMKVDRQGKALLIDWDRQSAAVLEATDATFTIHEGTHRKVIRLAAAELRNGGVLYTPQTTTSDVQVELALHTPGGNFAQSLRIVQDEPAVK